MFSLKKLCLSNHTVCRKSAVFHSPARAACAAAAFHLSRQKILNGKQELATRDACSSDKQKRERNGQKRLMPRRQEQEEASPSAISRTRR